MTLRSLRHALGETGRGVNVGGGWTRFAATPWERRIERPDPTDPRDLVILLRQASDSVDAAILRTMVPTLERHVDKVRPAHLTHVHILRRLARREITPTHLVDYLTRSKARVCALVDELEAAGLVTRVRDAGDRRHQRLRISETGRAIVDEVERVLDDMVDLLADEVGDLGELAERLARLADLR